MLFATSDGFTSSFPVWIPFISFSYLMGVARPSNSILNKNGKNEPPWLLILEEMLSAFHH